MSLRFRKSINLGHGVRFNIGKKGVGISAGIKGARVSVNTNGRKTTSVGIPGTGVSYVKSEKIGASTSGPQSQSKNQDLLQDNNNTPPPKKKPGCLPIVLGIVAVVCAIGFINWAAHGFPATSPSSSAASSALLTSSISEVSSTETSSEAVSSEESSFSAETGEPSSSLSSTLESSTPESSIPAETSKPATAASQKLTVTSAPGTVSKGSTASISIKGKPNTQYSIAVHYSSGVSKASGLESKMSDANGKATWSWKVGAKTKSGTYDVVISDGTDEIDSSVTIS